MENSIIKTILSLVCSVKLLVEGCIPDPKASEPPVLKVAGRHHGSRPRTVTQCLCWGHFSQEGIHSKLWLQCHKLSLEAEAEPSDGICYLVLDSWSTCSNENTGFTELVRHTQSISGWRGARTASQWPLPILPRMTVTSCDHISSCINSAITLYKKYQPSLIQFGLFTNSYC